MKTATVNELLKHFPKFSKRLEKGETIQITNRGKPFARLVPEKAATKTFVGATPVAYSLPDDLDDPVPVVWDAMK